MLLNIKNGGAGRNRTGVHGVAVRNLYKLFCLLISLSYSIQTAFLTRQF